MKYNAILLIILLTSCNTSIETEVWPQAENAIDQEPEIRLADYDTLLKNRTLKLSYPMHDRALWYKDECGPFLEIRMMPMELENNEGKE